MAINVKEIRRSRVRDRTTNSATRELELKAWYSPRVATSAISGNDIETAVKAHVRTMLGLGPTDPITIDDSEAGMLIFHHYSQQPLDDDEQVFDCVLGFGIPDPGDDAENPTPGEMGELSFDLSMATSHITQGIAQEGTTNAPDIPGIGWNGESYDGTDIMVPQFSWRETHFWPVASVDLAFINDLVACAANPVNDLSFRDFAPGEVLFAGCTGSLRNADTYAITYAFMGSPNVTDVFSTGLDKAGWDYLWRLYEKNEDTTNKWIVPEVKATYVTEVYGRSNFATLLGI